ncbi:MAG: phosphopyruvate hydratase [Candidatus Moranbacteria bacterium]|nr:phosphopyruvate hydratase [Candidatus Moranbacteria bacterium]
MKIKSIKAFEILDSRGNPTVRARVGLDNGVLATANVPSGASTGEHEALELRDKDPKRYNGKGVLKAVENVNKVIAPFLIGMEVEDQQQIDQKMLELDGTKNKSKLGANAILSVSLACARAACLSRAVPLYEHIFDLAGLGSKPGLPIITCNVINGGAHANWGLDFQEYMLVPYGIDTVKERLRALSEIYHTLKNKLKTDSHAVSVGDEGGFAPKLKDNEEALKYLMASIEDCGYDPGSQVGLAMDVAASEFFDKASGLYKLKVEKRDLNNEELIAYYKELCEKYPILIIEDGMDQDDIEGWKKLKQVLGEKIAVMGDDYTVTNKERLAEAISQDTINSILIKLNQIGTVSETIETIKLAYKNNIEASVSHRSGETCDDFIADFSVGVCSKWIKSGSVARSERVCKYNRLLEIEIELSR